MSKRLLAVIFTIHAACMAVHAQYANSITVETLLKTDTTAIGQRIAYPQVAHPEVSMLKITMAPGSTTGLHKHEIPLFAYVIQGSLTVIRENHEPRVFRAGDTIAEMIEVYHEGINNGDEDVILIACYLGGDNKPLAIAKQKDSERDD